MTTLPSLSSADEPLINCSVCGVSTEDIYGKCETCAAAAESNFYTCDVCGNEYDYHCEKCIYSTLFGSEKKKAAPDPCRAIDYLSVNRKQRCVISKERGTTNYVGRPIVVSTHCFRHRNREGKSFFYFRTLTDYEVWRQNEVKDLADSNEFYDRGCKNQIRDCSMCNAEIAIPLTQADNLCNEHIMMFRGFLRTMEIKNELSDPPHSNAEWEKRGKKEKQEETNKRSKITHNIDT